MADVLFEVVVVRHAERADRQGEGSQRAWREECPAGHEYDPPLSVIGLQQAESTAAFLSKEMSPDSDCVIITSPFTRCVQTAATIARKWPQKQLIIDCGLAEFLGEGLFPSCPPFLSSPTLDKAVMAISGLDEGILRDDTIPEQFLLSQWPEPKMAATQRHLAALKRHLEGRLKEVAKLDAKEKAREGGRRVNVISQLNSTQLRRVKSVIFVTHQFGCKSIVKALLTKQPHHVQNKKGKKSNWKENAQCCPDPKFDFAPSSLSILRVALPLHSGGNYLHDALEGLEWEARFVSYVPSATSSTCAT